MSKFLQMADNLQKSIDNRLSKTDVNTYRKLDMKKSQISRALFEMRVQTVLKSLASFEEPFSSQLPELLRGINTKKDVENLVQTKWDDVCVALADNTVFCNPQIPQNIQSWIFEAEVALKKIPGYFPTPKQVIEQYITPAIDEVIASGSNLLEPSAGMGHIADYLRDRYPRNTVDVIEYHPGLLQILKNKSHNIVHRGDFLEFNSVLQYDFIVMNPPFENKQDIDHVLHAYHNLLRCGSGLLIAIMSAGTLYRNDKKTVEFREFADANGHFVKLPDNAFRDSDRPTSVNTCIVYLEK